MQPVAGVVYSLQDASGSAVDAQRARAGRPLTFEFRCQLSAQGHLTSPFVRREGDGRRFVYVAVGTQAGDGSSCWDRRMKVQLGALPRPLIESAIAAGQGLEVEVSGTGPDGTPACATVPLLGPWRMRPQGP